MNLSKIAERILTFYNDKNLNEFNNNILNVGGNFGQKRNKNDGSLTQKSNIGIKEKKKIETKKINDIFISYEVSLINGKEDIASVLKKAVLFYPEITSSTVIPLTQEQKELQELYNFLCSDIEIIKNANNDEKNDELNNKQQQLESIRIQIDIINKETNNNNIESNHSIALKALKILAKGDDYAYELHKHVKDLLIPKIINTNNSKNNAKNNSNYKQNTNSNKNLDNDSELYIPSFMKNKNNYDNNKNNNKKNNFERRNNYEKKDFPTSVISTTRPSKWLNRNEETNEVPVVKIELELELKLKLELKLEKMTIKDFHKKAYVPDKEKNKMLDNAEQYIPPHLRKPEFIISDDNLPVLPLVTNDMIPHIESAWETPLTQEILMRPPDKIVNKVNKQDDDNNQMQDEDYYGGYGDEGDEGDDDEEDYDNEEDYEEVYEDVYNHNDLTQSDDSKYDSDYDDVYSKKYVSSVLKDTYVRPAGPVKI